jgi:hypothetical protein
MQLFCGNKLNTGGTQSSSGHSCDEKNSLLELNLVIQPVAINFND